MWKNQTPNSARSLCPIFLIREKEDDPDLLQLVIKESDAARKSLNTNGFDVSVNGEVLKIACKIKDTMKDLKFKSKSVV